MFRFKGESLLVDYNHFIEFGDIAALTVKEIFGLILNTFTFSAILCLLVRERKIIGAPLTEIFFKRDMQDQLKILVCFLSRLL